MEHVGGAGLEVEGVLRLIEDLLTLLHVEGLLLDEDCALDAKGVDEMADLLARAHQPPDLADSG